MGMNVSECSQATFFMIRIHRNIRNAATPDGLPRTAEAAVLNISQSTRENLMSSIFRPTVQISLDNLSPERLKRYEIKVVAGHERERVYAYLCSAETTVRVQLDANGYCNFVVPENCPFPFSIFDSLRNAYNCNLERVIDDRGHIVSSLSEQQVGDACGRDHQGPGDRIISYINGAMPEPDSGGPLNEKVRIGRNLVEQNRHLSKDPQTLLRLVIDLYEQRHPPFTVTLKTRNSKIAWRYAWAMLGWASKPTSVTEIKRELREAIESCLNDSAHWPPNSDTIENFWRALERMGLAVLGNAGARRYTDLGFACGAHLASYFIGAHGPYYDIPALLAQERLIEDQEAQEFYSFLAYYNDVFLAYFKDNCLEGDYMSDREPSEKAKRLAVKAYERFRSIEDSKCSEVPLDDSLTAGAST